jgi:hypothetical protein
MLKDPIPASPKNRLPNQNRTAKFTVPQNALIV